jgi:hypothetical protein
MTLVEMDEARRIMGTIQPVLKNIGYGVHHIDVSSFARRFTEDHRAAECALQITIKILQLEDLHDNPC